MIIGSCWVRLSDQNVSRIFTFITGFYEINLFVRSIGSEKLGNYETSNAYCVWKLVGFDKKQVFLLKKMLFTFISNLTKWTHSWK